MQVLLVPSAFTKVTGEAHWEILLRARAIETQCYVGDLFCYSHSLTLCKHLMKGNSFIKRLNRAANLHTPTGAL